jgi:uncharacterized protein
VKTGIEVRIVERVRDIARDEWDALVGDDGSPFLEHTWLDALEEAGCVGEDTGWLPRHLAVYRDGKLVAAAPSYVKGNSEGEFVFDWSWADVAHKMGLSYYPKIVVGVPFTPVTGQRALVAKGEDRETTIGILGTGLRKWASAIEASGIHILFPTEDETRLWTHAGFRERLGFQFHWANDGYDSMDTFLARFSSKKRNQLKREMAQPARDGMVIETLDPTALTPAMRDEMFGFYAATVDKFFYGRRYLNSRFFELVTERFAHRLSWVIARQVAPGGVVPQGELIAGAFNVRKGSRLYGRYWGAKADAPFLHFNVCYYHGIRQCIAEGLQVFEPGAGGEHKYARGFTPTFTHSAHWLAAPRLASIIYPFLERERDAVRAHVERERGEGPLKPTVLGEES